MIDTQKRMPTDIMSPHLLYLNRSSLLFSSVIDYPCEINKVNLVNVGLWELNYILSAAIA